ncbi:hypothetical protein GCM10007425_22220 [Lysinibacillus alkalisoli]|uniref:Uncharacterized protein n=1 Tax=Lysinibacillus alkalisoli TaxID=1911548 RepID=A0A917G7V8_9BACI|nr:hypothetical protein [Lysinibacillus alkalisoli]GGG27200.1 hypothetical protein GCM10007425_22220 [Lysinibacillus alkalisoli]
MNLVYKDYIFPFQKTNLERIIDGKYFKINRTDYTQEIQIQLDNEQMLLEFSKSLKATCSLLQETETEPYIQVNIDLIPFVEAFNTRYQLNAAITNE